MSFENTRIYKLLSALNPVTLNRFSKFIHSPYFNVNEKITSLYTIIENDIKKGDAVPSKEKIWTSVGFAGEYKDIKFRKLCNDLVERYERFLTIEAMESDELLKSNLMIKGIKDSKIDTLIEKHIGKSSTAFDRMPDRSSDYFLQKYTYEKNLQNLKTNYEKKEDIKKFINKASFDELSEQLDSFYIIEKLRYTIDIITWNRQYKLDINPDISVIQSFIEKNKLQESLPVNIYYLICRILTEDDSRDLYFELKELAKTGIYNFPVDEQFEIFSALFSYCVKWVNSGDLEFHKQYMELQDWGIQEEFILSNGRLSPTSFRNYVVIGLRIGEYDRVENYIKKNINLLEKKRQENALYFNLARLEFYKTNYDEVITNLRYVNYDDVWYNINSKVLLLATYYELEEIDPLYSLLDSYTAFLRREKSLEASRLKRHINFTNLLKRLVNYQGNKQQLLRLKEQILEEKNIVNRSWLLEKIEEELTH